MYDSSAQDNGVKMTTEKLVMILSGGLDSVTMLHRLDQTYDCYPVTFLYGQKHNREIEYAAQNCEKLGIFAQDHKIIDISDLNNVLNSALIQTDYEIPDTTQEEQRTQAVLKKTVVPFRNGIFLSIAIGYAASIGATLVAYGAHKNDFAVYPDCTPTFVRHFNRAAQDGLGTLNFDVIAPFLHYTKSDIVQEGDKLGVDFKLTWSCYRGGKIHCGHCPSCSERKRAFEEANVRDPTIYTV